MDTNDLVKTSKFLLYVLILLSKYKSSICLKISPCYYLRSREVLLALLVHITLFLTASLQVNQTAVKSKNNLISCVYHKEFVRPSRNIV